MTLVTVFKMKVSNVLHTGTGRVLSLRLESHRSKNISVGHRTIQRGNARDGFERASSERYKPQQSAEQIQAASHPSGLDEVCYLD